MPRTEFHRLRVARVDPLTGDSAAVTFDVPPGLAERFAFAPGQSLTVRRGEERRSYSICAARGRAPRIGVREVAGGAVSGWLVHAVRPGAPIGRASLGKGGRSPRSPYHLKKYRKTNAQVASLAPSYSASV